jgi:hypothetical protein
VIATPTRRARLLLELIARALAIAFVLGLILVLLPAMAEAAA